VELLTPHKLGVLQGWVQEKDVVLGFEFESHFFSDEVKLDILFVSVGEVDEFLDPFLAKMLSSWRLSSGTQM
jgi:hypothetical protein